MIDSKWRFSSEQALSATADSENVIGLGAGKDVWGSAKANPELADGKPVWLNVAVGDVALSSAAQGASLAVSLKTDADGEGTFTTVYTTAAIAEAALAAGAIILAMAIPLGLSRYNKLTYTVSGENFTAGNINAWIGLEPIRPV